MNKAELEAKLLALAARMAAEGGDPTEVYTADGIYRMVGDGVEFTPWPEDAVRPAAGVAYMLDDRKMQP
jgi:hypothetical protein